MSADDETLAALVGTLVPALLGGLDTLDFVARHFHPPYLAAVLESVGEPDRPLGEALEAFRDGPWRDEVAEFGDGLEAAAEAALAAFAGLRAAISSEDGVRTAFRALRQVPRAKEALYPYAASLRSISRFFLDPGAREDAALLDRLADPVRQDVGVITGGGEPGARGGFSLYVPETYESLGACPLVVALHGGSGDGATFLWTWLASARSRGAILLAPTAMGDTWGLTDPEADTANIGRIVEQVRLRWNVDPARLLLTGMSDGGTFTFASGLGAGSPFTHLAPIAASFHPLLLSMGDADRVRGLPVYMVHGALDWMFPASRARAAEEALAVHGARVVYREIEDLSHTYPRDENAPILDWLIAGPASPAS